MNASAGLHHLGQQLEQLQRQAEADAKRWQAAADDLGGVDAPGAWQAADRAYQAEQRYVAAAAVLQQAAQQLLQLANQPT